MIDKTMKTFKHLRIYVWLALAFCIVVLMVAYWWPGLADILSLETLDMRTWVLVIVTSFAALFTVQGVKQAFKI